MFPEAMRAAQPNARPLWLAAFFAAVSVPPTYWAVLILVEVAKGGSAFGEELMRSLGFLMVYAVPTCLAIVLVLGYPFALLLRKIGKLSALNVFAGSFGIGFVVTAAANLIASSGAFHILYPMIGGAMGLFAGIVFCLVAGIPFRRPTP
jgi:hypothetical protein